MGTVYAPRVVEVNYNFTYQGEACQNTLYWRGGVEPTAGNITALCTGLSTRWVTVAAPFVPDSVRLNSVEGTCLTSAVAAVGSYSVPGGADGDQAGQAMPSNVTIAASFRTGLAGRSNRGRNYWIGLLESEVANNRVAALTLQSIVGYYNGMVNLDIGDISWVWGVYSRRTQGADRTVGLFTPITNALFTNDVVDTQRNRLP